MHSPSWALSTVNKDSGGNGVEKGSFTMMKVRNIFDEVLQMELPGMDAIDVFEGADA